MHQKHFFSLWGVLTTTALLFSGEFSFPLSSPESPIFKDNHLKHSNTNTSMIINGVEVDFLRLYSAVESSKSVRVKFQNSQWEFAGNLDSPLNLPPTIRISEPFLYRGTLMVHIDIFPWRISGSGIETLIGGELIVEVRKFENEIHSPHPKLLNYAFPLLSRGVDSDTEYLILCPAFLNGAAEIFADLHEFEADPDDRLITEIVHVEDIPGSNADSTNYYIRNYLQDRIENDVSQSLKFLLLLGDENDLPAIFDNGYPSDDFYTTSNDWNVSSGEPQLYSGRIPVDNLNDALMAAEKVREYILNPTPGIWRSKAALVADDMYRSCHLEDNSAEASHTINSNSLFNLLKPFLPLQTFYGVDYSLQEASGGCAHPDLTADFIQAVNSGVGLINYIGHGDPTTWAGERIITKTRDLPLIHTADNKLAIWVAGTCSFGKYYLDNTFMEALLLKEDGAIAVISTTENIGYLSNFNFLESLVIEITGFILNEHDYRLGEMVSIAKAGNYKFHTFGDPALPVPFPKESNSLLVDYPTEITLIEPQDVIVSEPLGESTLLVSEADGEAIINYSSTTGDLVYSYAIPGKVFSQVVFSGSESCFRAPLDVEACEDCQAAFRLYRDDEGKNGKIQFIENIPLNSNSNAIIDDEGPTITVIQNGRTLSEGSVIIPGDYLTIVLDDESGINLMNSLGHEMRYWLDDNSPETIQGEAFSYTAGCSMGEVLIPTDYNLAAGLHSFHFEVWDGVNNQSIFDVQLEVTVYSSDSENFYLENVYPIPSPFSDQTHFTMEIISESPADITVTVYTLNGVQVWKRKTTNTENFAVIHWDGRDSHGNKIANGAYFYHVKAVANGKVFEDIYKVAKLE